MDKLITDPGAAIFLLFLIVFAIIGLVNVVAWIDKKSEKYRIKKISNDVDGIMEEIKEADEVSKARAFGYIPPLRESRYADKVLNAAAMLVSSDCKLALGQAIEKSIMLIDAVNTYMDKKEEEQKPTVSSDNYGQMTDRKLRSTRLKEENE